MSDARRPATRPGLLPGPLSSPSPGAPRRRVRHEVRDQALVMLFTLGASSLLTLALTVLSR